MSLILGKRALFWRDFRKKSIFLSIFTGKGLLNKRGPFFPRKKSVIGVFGFNLENDHTSPLLHVSGRTGPIPSVRVYLYTRIKLINVIMLAVPGRTASQCRRTV